MPRRRRWTPVRGTGNRIYDARERLLAGAVDLAGRAWFAAFGTRAHASAPPPRDVLVLRLDRIGDVVMSLPALHDLRRAFPTARLRLAVGAWSREVARNAPVDEVLVWSAPWAGRPHEGALAFRELRREAQALAAAPPDVALDLQGDVRASWLMHETGARRRVGYANTGGAYLLSDVVPLDETVSWVEQNRRAAAVIAGPPAGPPVFAALTDEDRAFATRLFGTLGLASKRPLVAVHPSGGRLVKQWDVARWAAVGRRLQEEHGATVLVTGSAADQPLAAQLARGLRDRPIDLTGKLGVLETMSVIAAVDLFLSPDTGPMHMACAVDTPSVSVFGPSDPLRYFSGGSGAPGTRHVVVRHELWCAPCNLIRKPPAECAGPEPPECLREVGVAAVYAAAARLLSEAAGRA
ncbi:MAG: glycosyltransferase family 9 protein [Vicinamibacteria bacterium]